eukprot:787424_1
MHIGCLERSHGLSIVVGNKSLKKRNTSLNPLFGDESHNTNHGQSSIVDLLNKSSALLLGTLILREAKGIEKVQGHGMGDHAMIRKLGISSRHSSAHVMRAGRFAEPLEESDEEDDLPLGGGGEGVPLFRRRSGGAGEGGAVEGDGPGEADAVGLDDVSYEGGHGDAAVLDFGVTEEGDGVVVGVSPDGGGGELEGIVELQHRVGLLGDALKVVDSGIGGNRGTRNGGGGKGRGGADQEGEERELHG